MKFVFISLLLCFQFYSISQSTLEIPLHANFIDQESDNEFIFLPNLEKIKVDLSNAPRYDDSDEEWIKMSIPFADGKYYEVEVAESPVVAKKIYDIYPENRSYKLRGINDNYISGRMSITPRGISALIFTKTKSIFIEPTQDDYHKAYDFDGSVMESFTCETDHSKFKPSKKSTSRDSYGSNERKYTIAIASTGEFSAEHGNNLANINAIINDYLTLLNTLYERDLAITFELTADNDDIIFFNPATDGLNPANSSTKLSSTQSVINSEIGSGNYDIGHAFYEMPPPSGGWWGSGVASLGIVCSSNSKARGWSGCGGSYPNSFWMGIFAHEVGHQFAATHSFYGTTGNCGGSQRSVGNGVEPGSGNSLMSYESTCGPYIVDGDTICYGQNITPESSFQYFHGNTIEQVQTFVLGSGSCYTSTSTGNSPPVITMPASKTIPTETPFYLSATVTDPDGDPLLNSWEEVDTDNLSLSCPSGAPNDAATSTTAPLFRSFDPSAEGELRNFPQLSDILDDTQTMGEILPEVGRTIDMRFTSRGTDPNGISGVSYEDVTITVDGNSGPFEVTTASTTTSYLASASVNIVWLVGNTDMSPVSCSNVNILFSTDGGNTFTTTLASNAPNDGLHTVTMPANSVTEGRIKVEAVGNIFYSINKGDITIISDCTPNSSSIVNDDDVTANEGDPSLDLDLLVGNILTSVSGTLDVADPVTNLIADDANSSGCQPYTNTPKYETFVFTASETDVYTFNSSAPFFEIINLYADVFIPPATNCQNWQASNLLSNPLSITNPFSFSMTEGDVIEMVVSGFYNSDLGAYTVNFTSNASGELIDTDIIPGGYVYKFVIYNAAGIVVGIEDEADLTDSNIYYNDVFTVEGLLVVGAVNLLPYINQNFSTLQNDITTGVICGEFSSNDVTVTVNGCNPGTKTVTSPSPLDDGSIGTLRYKIENACPGDMIQFHLTLFNSTIVLGNEIVIDQNLTIIGLGQNNLSISGNNSSRIFNINPGVNTSISNLSLKNGYAISNGGALMNNGILTLNNINFEGNKNGIISKAFTNLSNITMSNFINVLD